MSSTPPTPEQAARASLLSGSIALLEQGEQAERAGQLADAASLYKRAQAALQVIRAKEPSSVGQVDELLQTAELRLSSLSELESRLPHAQQFAAAFALERVRVFKIELHSTPGARVPQSQRVLLCVGSFQLLQAPSDAGLALSILKVSPHFQYPLTSDVPCLAMRPGYYVFPTPQPGTFYGIVFPRALPAAYSAAFETLCAAQCKLRRLPPEQAAKLPPLPGDDDDDDNDNAAAPPIASSTAVAHLPTEQQVAIAQPTLTSRAIKSVSGRVESGGEALVRTVAKTGVWLASGVAAGGSALRERIAPAAQPLAVRPEVKAGVKAVATVTPHLVFVSKTLIGALLDLATATGQVIGEAVAQRVGGDDPKAPPSATKAAVMEFGKSTVITVGNVWDALEEAGTALVNAVGAQAVQTVDHKYGADAAAVATDATHVVGNVLETAYTVKGVVGKKALKTLGRRAVRKMAKAGTVTYFSYDGEQHRTLTIEPSLVTPQLLIEGAAPSAPAAADDETDEWHECDEDAFGSGSEIDGDAADAERFEECAEDFKPQP
jgi:hypothetical protein